MHAGREEARWDGEEVGVRGRAENEARVRGSPGRRGPGDCGWLNGVCMHGNQP